MPVFLYFSNHIADMCADSAPNSACPLVLSLYALPLAKCPRLTQFLSRQGECLVPVMTYLHERKYGRFFKRNDLHHVCDVFRTVIGINRAQL